MSTDYWHARHRDDGCYDIYDPAGRRQTGFTNADGAAAHHVACFRELLELRERLEQIDLGVPRTWPLPRLLCKGVEEPVSGLVVLAAE